MIVNNRLPVDQQDSNCFYVTLFTVAEHVQSSQLIKFRYSSGSWGVTKRAVPIKDLLETKFINAFIVDQDQIVLITWYSAFIFNEALELEHEKKIEFSDIDDCIKGLLCCVTDLATDQKGYLMSFQVD